MVTILRTYHTLFTVPTRIDHPWIKQNQQVWATVQAGDPARVARIIEINSGLPMGSVKLIEMLPVFPKYYRKS